jgi:hypothetical protein
MQIRNIRRSDFMAVVKIGMAAHAHHTHPDFPVTDASCLIMLNRFMDYLGYFKVMLIEGEIVGWMGAYIGHPYHHSTITGYSQIYYQTNLTGIKAVKGLIEFHDHYFKHVEKHGYQIALSNSYLPNNAVFNRILEKHGWSEWNGVLSRKTGLYPCQARTLQRRQDAQPSTWPPQPDADASRASQ